MTLEEYIVGTEDCSLVKNNYKAWQFWRTVFEWSKPVPQMTEMLLNLCSISTLEGFIIPLDMSERGWKGCRIKEVNDKGTAEYAPKDWSLAYGENLFALLQTKEGWWYGLDFIADDLEQRIGVVRYDLYVCFDYNTIDMYSNLVEELPWKQNFFVSGLAHAKQSGVEPYIYSIPVYYFLDNNNWKEEVCNELPQKQIKLLFDIAK